MSLGAVTCRSPSPIFGGLGTSCCSDAKNQKNKSIKLPTLGDARWEKCPRSVNQSSQLPSKRRSPGHLHRMKERSWRGIYWDHWCIGVTHWNVVYISYVCFVYLCGSSMNSTHGPTAYEQLCLSVWANLSNLLVFSICLGSVDTARLGQKAGLAIFGAQQEHTHSLSSHPPKLLVYPAQKKNWSGWLDEKAISL